MASSKKSHEGPAGSHSMAAKLRRYLPLYLMFLPGAIYLLINNYIPMAGIIVAFKKYNARLGIWKSPFCGQSVGTSKKLSFMPHSTLEIN